MKKMDVVVCSFEGCDKPPKAKLLCNGHYWQMRRGQQLTPLLVMSPAGEPLAFLQRLATGDAVEGCVLWPYGKSSTGYGAVMYDGVLDGAHRVVLKLRGVEIPDWGHVLHSCDVRGCVNPAHLRVGTHAENMADNGERTAPRGEHNHASKLTADQVRELVALSGTVSGTELATRYGIKHATVYNILNGKTWTHVTGLRKGETNAPKFRETVMTPETVLELVSLSETMTGIELAARYGVSTGVVYNILNGKTWTSVTGLTSDDTLPRPTRRKPRPTLAKLTRDQVLEILEMRDTLPVAQIAKRFGVTTPAIYAILNGRTWRHVTGLPKIR